ncbi:MAG TPA: prepilin-type N-terminal cleavage/methylation domain-containing protein [Pseudoxanthomonas sp.]|nr:prepilin-type N-terminal cleavage/methylation domain-containing protein [Pseudoxanthomonas sp.]
MLMGFPSRRQAAGFTLIEMMVALVVGLIVTIAVIAFIVAIMRSNNQTIQATRMTQELRAMLAVVANDLKRARSVADPLVAATGAAGNQLYVVNTSTAGCVQYAYEGGIGGNWRAIYRDAATNRLVLVAADSRADATCSEPDDEVEQLNSNQVAITAFTISPSSSSTSVRRYDITITGALSGGNVVRTMRQTVFVRSLSGT